MNWYTGLHMGSSLTPVAQLTRRDDAIVVDKGNGTTVHYYTFPNFEIHTCLIEPGTQQEWHHHSQMEETLLVTDGELTALFQEDGRIREEIMHPGDLVRLGTSVHNFANRSNKLATFQVFRFVPDDTDTHELLKNDRFPDDVQEHM